MKIIKILLLASVATSAIADTTLTFTDKKDNISMKMQFSNNMMRATSMGSHEAYMVYNATDVTFTTINPKDKQYYIMDKESIEKLSDVGAMMDAILEKQLAEMPESQREMMRGMMEKMVRSQMPKEMPKADYRLTGKSKSYNGFDCEVVKKKSKKNGKSEFCVTKYSNLGMSSSEYKVIVSFQKTTEAIAQQFGQDHSMDFSSLGEYLPVKYNQSGESGMLSDVNHDNLDSIIFAIPEGYSKIDMPF